MAIGPVQLLVFGFEDPAFTGEISEVLRRLQDGGTVRVIDSLAVFKDAAGEIEVQHLSNGSEQAVEKLGRLVGALIGLEVEGEEELFPMAGSEAMVGEADPLSEEEGWDVLQDIPDDTSAALVLIEHRWALPLRDAIVQVGGFRISDGFISPDDLVEIGLASAAEADALRAIG